MTSSETREVLVINRSFSAPIDRVFDAWTNAEVLAKWFGPEGFSVIRSEVQLHVGGRYDIEICSPDGKHIKHFGEYLEISKPDKLSFTWMLADQACKGGEGLDAETIVSIEFKTVEKATEIILTHEQLPSKEALDGHKFGWTSSLNSLQDHFKNME